MTYIDLFTFEDIGEALGNPRFDGGSRHRTAELFERGNASVGNPARNDEVEMAEVGRMVQRETMAGHPPRDAHANSREFLASDPHTGQTGDPACVNVVIGSDAD